MNEKESYRPTPEERKLAEAYLNKMPEEKEMSKKREKIFGIVQIASNKMTAKYAEEHLLEKGKYSADDLIEIFNDFDSRAETKNGMTPKEEFLTIASRLNSVGLTPNQATKLMEIKSAYSEKFLERLLEYSEKIQKAAEEFAEIGGFNESIFNLSNEQLSQHLRVRERLIHLAFLPIDHEIFRGSLSDKMYLAFQGKSPSELGIESSGSYSFNEQEIIYSTFLTALNLTSRDFLKLMEEACIDSLADFTPEKSVSPRGLCFLHGDKIARAERFSQLAPHAMKDRKIFEVGGSAAVDFMTKNWGARVAGKADPGHSGYDIPISTIVDQATSREREKKMIKLFNYRDFAYPHSADVVCSSRLFDFGSGIHLIAEPKDYSEDPDILGQKEMILIMSNIAKDGGFLIHFNSPINEEFYESCGWRKVANIEVSYSRGTNIFRYCSADKDPEFNSVSLGKKDMEYDEKTQTWEMAQ